MTADDPVADVGNAGHTDGMKWFLLLPCTALLACAQKLATDPSLCDLAERREEFTGQTVTVEGYLLASEHGNSVTDPRCGYGTAISWKPKSTNLRTFEAYVERAGREPLMIEVRVTGRVRQDRNLNMLGERGGELDLSAAKVLRAVRLRDADEERYISWLEGPSPAAFVPSR